MGRKITHNPKINLAIFGSKEDLKNRKEILITLFQPEASLVVLQKKIIEITNI